MRWTLDAWSSPTGGSPKEPAILFRGLSHMHIAATITIKCILRILVSEAFRHKCQQATMLRPSKVCWITWRKPEVWAQSARYPSQRHSFEHPVITELHTSANPTACTEHSIPYTNRYRPGACQEHVIYEYIPRCYIALGTSWHKEWTWCVSHEDSSVSSHTFLFWATQ